MVKIVMAVIVFNKKHRYLPNNKKVKIILNLGGSSKFGERNMVRYLYDSSKNIISKEIKYIINLDIKPSILKCNTLNCGEHPFFYYSC